MEQVVIQFSADISKLLPAIEAFEKVGLIDKKNGDIFRTTSAEYSKRNQVLDQTIAKNKELDKTISSGAVEAHTADIKENTKAIEQNTQGTENLNKKLKEMQKELIAMEAAGEQNTARFKELNKQAAELKDTIGDAKERVKSFASDTKRLDAVATSFKLITASAAAMQGAFALFGGESAELQKTMMKLQGAMALLAGVQEIAAFATGQSYLKTVLLDGAQKLVAASATAMGVSVGTATAIMTGGLSVIASVVALLIAYSDEEETLKDTITRTNTVIDSQKDKINDLKNSLQNAQIEYQVLTGQINQAGADLVMNEIDQKNKRLDAEKEFNNNRITAIKEGIKMQIADQKAADELLTKLEIKNGEVRFKKGAEYTDKELNAMLQANNQVIELEKIKNQQLDLIDQAAAQNAINITEKENQRIEEINKRAAEKAKQDAQKAADDAYRLAVARAQADLLAQQQIEANRKRQLQIETDWNRDRTEIDMMYQKIVQEGNLTTSEAIYTEIEKRLQANADYYNKLLTDDAAANKQLAANAKAQTEIQLQYKKSQADIDDMYAKIASENAGLTSDQIYAIIKKQLDDEVKATEDAEKKKEELRKQSIKFAIDTAQQLADFAIEQQQREIDTRFENNMAALEREKAAVLENQNLTEAQKLATEEYFENRRKKLQIQKFKETQRLNIQAALINTALAVTAALAAGPYPAAFFTAAGAAVAGALQVAKIRSTPIPQFAEGTEFLEGAGDGTSDSIPAMLSRGERVVPAKTNKDYFDGLSVIQNRLVAPELVNTLLTNLAENGGMLAAPSEAITQLEQQFGIDYARLGKEFQKGRTQVSINIDEKGFTKHIQQGLNRSTYHNQKFRFKQ